MNGTVRATQWGYSLWEFAVYTGTTSVTNTPTASNTPVQPPSNAPSPSPTTTASCGTTNIALNKTATASSVTGTNTANFAVDGNGGTRWESAYSDPQWIQVDLGSRPGIRHVRKEWRTA